MKKTYMKPQLVFESMTLQSPVGSCTFQANSSENSCSYFDEYTGLAYFAAMGVNGCDFEPAFDGSFCVHMPSDEVRIFAS